MTGKTEILLIEDDQAQAELMREMLLEVPGQQYKLQHVAYLAQGLELLKSGSFDCVMVDLGLPDSQGLDSALSIRRQARDVPIVILTVLDDEETALRALRMDIQDYLIKGEISRPVLVRSLRYATERKATADRLSESEARLRYASEAADIGMWHWDLTKGTVILSDKSKELFGLEGGSQPSYDEILGRVHPEDRQRVDVAVHRAVDRNQDYAEELRVVLPDGAIRWVLARGRAYYDDFGKPVRMAGINMDISEGKRAEKRIEELNEELARQAAELEASNRELESFNYTAAHDLQQPLNLIFGYCQAIEMLCGSGLSEDCHSYLQDIYQGVRRMARLLDALLNFSRMTRVELRRAPVDLSALAHRVTKELADLDPGRAATFRIAEGIMADGDPALLEIVLQNLLGNAWKYATAKEAIIEFGVTARGETRTYFVRDNGPGFDPAHAERLFTPFQRLPGAKSAPGFGIGLATVQRIVERHGGRVWAEGEPGVGATFYFTLN